MFPRRDAKALDVPDYQVASDAESLIRLSGGSLSVVFRGGQSVLHEADG